MAGRGQVSQGVSSPPCPHAPAGALCFPLLVSQGTDPEVSLPAILQKSLVPRSPHGLLFAPLLHMVPSPQRPIKSVQNRKGSCSSLGQNSPGFGISLRMKSKAKVVPWPRDPRRPAPAPLSSPPPLPPQLTVLSHLPSHRYSGMPGTHL